MASPLLVFDLDGTLVDSAPDLLATLGVVLARHGYDASGAATLRDGIGRGARHLIEVALARQHVTLQKPALDALHRDFLDHYEANICVESTLYPGVPALLDRFAAADWGFAVCTNKKEGLSRLLLEKLGVAQCFAAICGSDTFPTSKPHPGHLTGTIEAASGNPESAIMVGDSRTDIDTARAAEIPFVGVTFGYTPVPMAALRPDVLIHDYDALSLETAARLNRRETGETDAVRRAGPSTP